MARHATCHGYIKPLVLRHPDGAAAVYCARRSFSGGASAKVHLRDEHQLNLITHGNALHDVQKHIQVANKLDAIDGDKFGTDRHSSVLGGASTEAADGAVRSADEAEAIGTGLGQHSDVCTAAAYG
jgi:hypothetical protein